MPLYEYQCQACGQRLEKIQKFSDPELTTCPQCGGKLERLLHAPAVQFAGGGWYKDLYSSAKPAASSSNGSGSGESAAPASSGSGESKGASSASAPAAPSGSTTPTKS